MTDLTSSPTVSVVIPSLNGADLLEPCLASLAAQTRPPLEVIVVDNASGDGSAEVTGRFAPAARMLRQERNLGFAEACNRGIREARGEWVAVLNNDTEAAPDWIERCLEAAARRPGIAFVACRILESGRRDRIYSAGECFLRGGIGYRRGQEQEDHSDYRGEGCVFAAGGCASLYRRDVLERAGGFDPEYFAYLEDVDLGLRLRAADEKGWYAGSAVVYHRGGATSGGEFSPLAVRLRTRNALLLLGKCLPAAILWRSAPMILLTQAAWLARVLAHGRLGSYLHGLAQAARRAPAIAAARRRQRQAWRESSERLWRAIRDSEAAARSDLARPGASENSAFLRWYFRLFG